MKVIFLFCILITGCHRFVNDLTHEINKDLRFIGSLGGECYSWPENHKCFDLEWDGEKNVVLLSWNITLPTNDKGVATVDAVHFAWSCLNEQMYKEIFVNLDNSGAITDKDYSYISTCDFNKKVLPHHNSDRVILISVNEFTRMNRYARSRR